MKHQRIELTLTQATPEDRDRGDFRNLFPDGNDWSPAPELDPTGYFSKPAETDSSTIIADTLIWRRASDGQSKTMRLVINLGHPYLRQDGKEERLCCSSHFLAENGDKLEVALNKFFAPASPTLHSWLHRNHNKAEANVHIRDGKPCLFLQFVPEGPEGVPSGRYNKVIFPGFYLTHGEGKTIALWGHSLKEDTIDEADKLGIKDLPALEFSFWTPFYVNCKVGEVQECTSSCKCK